MSPVTHSVRGQLTSGRPLSLLIVSALTASGTISECQLLRAICASVALREPARRARPGTTRSYTMLEQRLRELQHGWTQCQPDRMQRKRQWQSATAHRRRAKSQLTTLVPEIQYRQRGSFSPQPSWMFARRAVAGSTFVLCSTRGPKSRLFLSLSHSD